MTTEDAVKVLNANEHLGSTDWHVGRHSGDVFCGSNFIPASKAIRVAQQYVDPKPKAAD